MPVKAAIAVLLAASGLHAENSLMECVADAWYSPAAKLDGSGRTLKLGKSGGAILLAFRTAAIEHWKVEKAVIVIHLAEASEPVELSVSLTGAPWRESSVDTPPLRETTQSVEKPKSDGWISIPVPAALVQAVVDGKATGLALSAPHSDQVFHSRETAQYSPFLAVIGRRR